MKWRLTCYTGIYLAILYLSVMLIIETEVKRKHIY